MGLPRLALVGALVAALSGCAAPLVPSPATPAAAPLSWGLAGCREVTAQFEVDASALQAQLPAGFTAAAGRTPGKSPMGIDAFLCQGAASYASFWAAVTPPAALKGNATSWYVKWDPLLADAATREALARQGATARAGRVSFADATPLPQGGTTCSIAWEGVGDVSITLGPLAQTPGGGSVKLREFTTRSGGLFAWDATLAQRQPAVGTGYADVPPGSVPARLYGAARIPVLVSVAASDLTNATISAV
ncbi:MAG: hypothetical protein QOE90_1069 [Thermoplasmata archaeon]|jgi:hypothetical protein|nr:hypothetical protein [Thermoplasmata archaeon]